MTLLDTNASQRAAAMCILTAAPPRWPVRRVVPAGLAALICLFMHGSPVTCTRPGDLGGGTCRAAGRDYPLAQVQGLAFETSWVRNAKTGFRTATRRLVLETTAGPVPAELSFSRSPIDRRDALVNQFQEFRAGTATSFPGPLFGLPWDLAALVFIGVAAWPLVMKRRPPTDAHLSVAEGSHTLVVTRESPAGPQVWEVSLSPPPAVSTRDDGRGPWLCFMYDGLTTPVVAVSTDRAKQIEVVERVEAFLKRVEAPA
jgi:hypothetical protein